MYDDKGYTFTALKYVILQHTQTETLKHILSFPKNYFKKYKQRPLTPAMVRTLKLACEKQNKRILFGPQDIKGSAITLIRRGLIASHTIEFNGKSELTWYVTQRAITMLADTTNTKILC